MNEQDEEILKDVYDVDVELETVRLKRLVNSTTPKLLIFERA
jgi:hypothetical protein